LSRAKDNPQYLDSALVSDGSRKNLDSDNPSDFIAGLVILISLWRGDAKVKDIRYITAYQF
jgi:hypothetical protein